MVPFPDFTKISGELSRIHGMLPWIHKGMMSMRDWWFGGALLLAGAPALSAQGLPIKDLPKPVKEISDPFSTIVAAKEMKPRQLIVSDGAEGQVSLVDFSKGSKTAIGRKGAGPGEYTIAAALFGLAGDTLWILDGAG